MDRYGFNHVGEQTLSVTTAAQSLTIPAFPNSRPTAMILRVDGAGAVRWRSDGTAPTSTTGQYLGPGERLLWTDSLRNYAMAIVNFQIIRDASAGANTNVEISYLS